MLRFDVPNMTCGGCARGVTRAVQKVDPSAKVEADPPTRLVVVPSAVVPAVAPVAAPVSPAPAPSTPATPLGGVVNQVVSGGLLSLGH